VTTWLLTIARSRAIDRLRARAVRERTTQSVEAPPPRPSPVEDLEQRMARERIQLALAELPAEQREALELAYFEGLSQREIAARTGDPLGTVKTRVRLAVMKLAGLLGGLR
jgi:RNA polymerase sigma-70 factor (ECF subfamily)